MTPANAQTKKAYSKNPREHLVRIAPLLMLLEELTWLDRIVEDLINSLDILVRGRVEHDDDSSDQADGAP